MKKTTKLYIITYYELDHPETAKTITADERIVDCICQDWAFDVAQVLCITETRLFGILINRTLKIECQRLFSETWNNNVKGKEEED